MATVEGETILQVHVYKFTIKQDFFDNDE